MADIELAGAGRVLVIGLGRSGRAAIDALAAEGMDVVAVDAAEEPPQEPLPDGVELRLGTDGTDELEEVDLVVPSPGVPEHAPVLQAALHASVPVWSEPELGWRLAPRRLVGITGTNGKTSVTELTSQMLQADGVAAVACGNIGNPFTTAALGSDEDAVLVAELSSFQLRFCHRLRARVGVLLNLEPDHLDWHGDLATYGAAKARIWRGQQKGDWAVVNADDAVVSRLAAEHARHGVAWFSGGVATDAIGVRWRGDELIAHLPSFEGPVVSAAALSIDAPHHRANVAAAACAALLSGASAEAVTAAASAFRPGAHRLEIVVTHDGVTYVDDSKATNVGSARAALRSFERIVWIAGGLAKGADLSELADELGTVRHAILIGEAADELREVCHSRDVPTTRADSMPEAVAAAAEVAEAGDTVLLAPACASFDMFRDYAARGDEFATAARQLRDRNGEAG